MSGTDSTLAELLADCDDHGIRLLPAGDGGLAIDAPRDALTPELTGRLKAHKGELLALLRPQPCPVCSSALAWRLPGGAVRCAVCLEDAGEPTPQGATLLLLVDWPKVPHWVDYESERTKVEAERLATIEGGALREALPTAKPTRPVCRCGSTSWRDVPIHGGQSVRRDCGRCGRFVDFPVWHGIETLQKDK